MRLKTYNQFLKKKEQIAYLLTTFLVRERRYSQAEIDDYIITNIKFHVCDDPRLAADHLRRAMIEFGYLHRTIDGGQYWVSDAFVSPLDLEKQQLDQLNSTIGMGTDQKVNCPFCKGVFRTSVLVCHYYKKHTIEIVWLPLIEGFFM